jgi:8-oxo-dGTP pyrophosphatase MutT (NUDIX family)
LSIEAGEQFVHYPQSGVIPFKMVNSEIEILLISTKSRRHWITPKGLIEDGLTPAETAIQEAYEEAGIQGELFNSNVGIYRYQKWGGTCEVEIFLLAVTRLLDRWPEDYFRERVWRTIDEARTMVKYKGLSDILSAIAPIIQTIFRTFPQRNYP